MSNKLTAKQEFFVLEYLVDLNATQAAIRAGYSEKTAEVQASRLLSKAKVREAVQAAMDARQERTGIEQDYVLERIRDVIERCWQARPVKTRSGEFVMVENRDGVMCPAYTFNAQAVLRGCELLGKHLGMFVTKHEHTGKDGKPIEVEVVSSVIHRIWDENEAKKVEE